MLASGKQPLVQTFGLVHPDYLRKRFIQVVVGEDKLKQREIFSSVPQGGKWSAPLWDFEIATIGDIDLEGLIFRYADVCSLFYEITKGNRAITKQ